MSFLAGAGSVMRWVCMIINRHVRRHDQRCKLLPFSSRCSRCSRRSMIAPPEPVYCVFEMRREAPMDFEVPIKAWQSDHAIARAQYPAALTRPRP